MELDIFVKGAAVARPATVALAKRRVKTNVNDRKTPSREVEKA
jgi:hypothetical protein